MKLFRTISIQERVDFTKSLSIMLKSGITINEALADLSLQDESSHFGKIIDRVRSDIENGSLLSEAFGKESATFGTIFISLIKAGEESGTLQGNLQFLAEWLGRSADLKREVAAAMMYPKLVFGAAIILGGGLAIFILPKLVPLFTGLKVELPWITQALLSVSLFVQESWSLCIVGIVFMILIWVVLNKFFIVRKTLHQIYVSMPFMGSLIRNYQLALITQLFATLLKSGLSLNESVSIVSKAATNISYQESLEHIQNSILKGTTLSQSLLHSKKLFPSMMTNIVAVGEKSGTLVISFEYLTEFYSKEVDAETKKLPTIIEPLLLVFIAVIVGCIALAIIMPIYKLTGSISK